MNVLLTGGAGYIGSHTSIELLSNGYNIIIADNFCNSSPAVIKRIENLSGKHVQVFNVDITQKEAIEPIFSNNKIDAVIHFAGLKSVAQSVREPLLYYRNNIDSTLTVLELMQKYQVKYFVFSSSATVYGTPQHLPIREDDPTGRCTNPYGRTKLFIEQIITDTVEKNQEFSSVILRYFNPVGAHPSGLIGEMPNGIPNNLMPFITQVAQGKMQQLFIFGNDYPTKDGTGIRDYIHVVDLAKGHLAALNFSFNHSGTSIFNLGTGTGYSVLEMIHTFEKVNNISVPYSFTSRREGDVPEVYSDTNKANRLLGWKALYSLEDMCKDSWVWQTNNPTGYE